MIHQASNSENIDKRDRSNSNSTFSDGGRFPTWTDDIHPEDARRLVGQLAYAGVVTPNLEFDVYIHEPSGRAFDSMLQLAVFHRGWTAAMDDPGEG